MTDGAIEVDLLVVGGGMAGLSAAAYVATRGGRVLLVEKARQIGGSALLSAGGLARPRTPADLKAVNPHGEPWFADMLVDDYDSAVDWVTSLGIAVTDPDDSIVAVMGYPTSLRGHDVGSYLPRCQAVIEAAGGHVVLQAEVAQLRRTDGRVTGAVVVDRDGPTEVVATWTLLATGGFVNDAELRSRYIGPNAASMIVRANPVSDGAGLRLGLAAGGTTTPLMDRYYGHTAPWPLDHPFTRADYVRLTQHYLAPHSVLLDRQGNRFVDESLGYYRNSHEVLRQPDGHALLVADQQVRDADAAGGAPEKTLGYERVDRVVEAMRSGAHVVEAATWAELDELVRPWGYTGVAAAMATYHHQLRDEAPMSPPRSRNREPLDQPPFFAMEIQSTISNTWGGLQIDEQTRVLRPDGDPVPGLLAAGGDVGGAFYDAYCGGLGMALMTGLRAARLVAAGLPIRS